LLELDQPDESDQPTPPVSFGHVRRDDIVADRQEIEVPLWCKYFPAVC
jgi:hypothetical protein